LQILALDPQEWALTVAILDHGKHQSEGCAVARVGVGGRVEGANGHVSRGGNGCLMSSSVERDGGRVEGVHACMRASVVCGGVSDMII